MKRLSPLLLTALIALIAALPARAQGYTGYSAEVLVAGGTNNIAGATTNTYSAGNVMTLTRQREVGLSFVFGLTGAATSTHQVLFSSSLDGLNWKTNDAGYSLTLTANGTATTVFNTNLTVGAVGYLRLESFANTNASQAVTNLYILYSVKR